LAGWKGAVGDGEAEVLVAVAVVADELTEVRVVDVVGLDTVKKQCQQ
jgi:hypothetical protein